MRVKKNIIAIFVVVVLLCLLLWNANKSQPLQRQTRFLMDTYISIHAVGPKKTAFEAINSAFERIKEIDSKFSAYNPKNQVYAFNNKNQAITDGEIIKLAEIACSVSRQTDGAFDITTLPLKQLWGFDTDNPHLPDDKQIEGALKNIGYQGLLVGKDKLEKLEGSFLRIDFGAIAKGYALSEAARVLKEKGITSAIIDAGGDIYALGRKSGKLWKVGIKDPKAEGILGFLEVEDISIAGSGDYERFFIADGKKYHHIFDPKTGYPSQGLCSVTVVYKDPVMADAFATAFFVLGTEKALEFCEKIAGLEAVLIKDSQEIVYSQRLEGKVNIIK
ncbi:MAG: FAD:protein FMN transferase [Candidatus Omnitrophica bacterium]|nr:FAD:protein FMN transferase [Candidatus Omnitrophota bacterium]